MCFTLAKAFAFIANTNAQTFTTSGTISPGNAVHGFGSVCGCRRTIGVENQAIDLRACGYYSVNVSAEVTASDAGNVTLSLYQDGNLVASESTTIAAAADPGVIAFPAGIKVSCTSSLTLVVSASAGNPTVNDLYITAVKL